MQEVLHDQAEEAEVIISVPLSMLKELDYMSGSKLTKESNSSVAPDFSAEALGRSDRITCDKKSSFGDYSVKLVKSS